ncbi:hypothetical protein BGW38_009865 [Lunasporangiospora selenospora]|uniref:valine--tRNA ligase n=1 Tax=Lunasporangiospora selenospora TaxID=979761 RepID=A0A9P6KFZ9_9FUNG|nr:hypothetical protein BGW38_009865 [Lunasporangiospora selenospora]
MLRAIGRLPHRLGTPTRCIKATFVTSSRGPLKAQQAPVPKPRRSLEKYDTSLDGYFAPRTSTSIGSSHTGDPSQKPREFTILTPPPNVTGYLHIGHALTASIQDSIVRWRRMRGESVSWIPGMDHAGISTQTVVEKKLMRERQLTRHDLGRSAFIEQIWDWKNLHGDRIMTQFRRLGASVDWDQSFFTLDEPRSKAVKSAFIQLFNQGLVYRDTRLVNWCCALETVISDIEVDHEDVTGRTMLNVPGRKKKVEFGVLHEFAYKVEGGSDQELVVSTTRIETMLGDVAVAIHPDDPRYKHLHGQYVIHPISGKRLPIICDDQLVDMSFGTGAVKITPAHDPNDYAFGKRHSLPIGMNRFDAREKIVADLTERGMYRGKNENHAMRLARCSRSGDVIEPLVMPQWYVKCDTMAEKALEAAQDQRLVFHPDYSVKDWNRWLENIQDWCISRQLWWGHRIPAYKAIFEDISEARTLFSPETLNDGPWLVGDSEEEAAQSLKSTLESMNRPDLKFKLVQDDDVLDTWFSSALLPLSSLGWTGNQMSASKSITNIIPDRYPTSIIETGTDIMFFWVARMVMLCTQLSGQEPFKDIMFHAMVRDAQGKKMSKSVGNVIDPMHVIEGIALKDLKATVENSNLAAKEVKRSLLQMEKDYPNGIKASGADALRYTLVSATQQTRQINLDLSNVASAQHFANKLWNLYAFSKTRFDDAQYQPMVQPESTLAAGLETGAKGNMSLVERFIMSRLADTVTQVNQGMEQLEPSTATDALRKFIIQDLCDVYVEFCKPALFSPEEPLERKTSLLRVLQTCLDASFRMMHPFMPFVTEELWQRMLPESASPSTSIMTSAFPTASELGNWKDEAADRDMEIALGLIQGSRSLRQSHQVPMSRSLPFTIWTSDPTLLTMEGALQQALPYLTHFTRAQGPLTIIDGTKSPLPEELSTATAAVHVVMPHLKLYAPLAAIQTAKELDAAAGAGAKADAGAQSKARQELKRYEKKLGTIRADLEKLEARLARPEYMERVPENVREFDAKRKEALLVQEEHLLATIRTFQGQ